MRHDPKSNELKISRVYDAPARAVWDAWTDPAQTAQWWGPRGFTITTHAKDLRPGGVWHYTMHGPDGVDYPNKTLYHEVEPLQKLVYDHGGNDEKAPLFRVTVLFREAGGKTHMDMTMTLPTPEAAAQTAVFVKQAGGNATWDRLAEYLEKISVGREIFVINRTFEAPIDLMFDMWTDPKHVSQWSGPAGSQTVFLRADIKTGGSAFYAMSGGAGTMHGKVSYLKVERPSLFVYTQQFCDEHENLSRHPMAPVWPETMLTTIRFTEEGESHTRVTITWTPFGDVTPEELEAFIAAKGGMTQGWTGSLDKLEEYAARAGS